MSGICFYIMTTLLAQPGLEGTLERGKPSTVLQKSSLKIKHYCQRLECSPTAAWLGTSHLYLGCCNAALSPTRPHPAGCQLWHSWHRKEQAPAPPSTAVSQVSAFSRCANTRQSLVAVHHFHLLTWLRERLRSDSELSHTCMHTVLTCVCCSHRSCLRCRVGSSDLLH